jgi:Uma2 family endonuclease
MACCDSLGNYTPFMAAVLDIASIADQHAFNLTRWDEICHDPVLRKVDHRIETDRFGHILMTVPPGFDHGERQVDIVKALDRLLDEGRAVTECPISTSDGVKAADVVWISKERRARAVRKNVLIEAPEICVEILSPTNTRQEIEHKKGLYFESGADEVWICDLQGHMIFFLKHAPETPGPSHLCPRFPDKL